MVRVVKWVVTVALVSIAVGCSVSDAHPKRKCKTNDDCKVAGQYCYHGFCVVDEDNGSSGMKNDAATDGGRSDGGKVGDAATDGGGVPVDGGGDAGPDGSMGPPDDPALGTPCSLSDPNTFCFSTDVKTASTGDCRPGVHVCECPEGETCECPEDEKDCKNGTWGPCMGELKPTAETCNGSDDDCDGEADEDVAAASCTVPDVSGACAQGEETCESGSTVCRQTGSAGVETCNGVDDDCDGDEDEDIAQTCFPAGSSGCDQLVGGGYSCKGLCAAGVQQCTGGVLGDCNGAVVPVAESCAPMNGAAVDEDCDNKTDEDESCACTDGVDYPCYGGAQGTAGTLPCHPGTAMCTGGALGSCEDQRTPQDETCANDAPGGSNDVTYDDDCDGAVDDVPHRGEPCTVGSQKGRCQFGTRQCDDDQLVCVTQTAIDEICGNGQDDDCDGVIDNGFDLQNDEANCGACGNECAASELCCRGQCRNVTDDALYCGSCTNRCNAGWGCCGGTCRNLLGDVNNCGTCGKTCGVLIPGLLAKCCSGTCC